MNSIELFDSLPPISLVSSSDGSLPSEVSVANGVKVPIQGTGKFMGSNADFVPTFQSTLVSVGQFCVDNNAVAIFDNARMLGFERSPIIDDLINQIQIKSNA